MTVTVITETPCIVCGYRIRGVLIHPARATKTRLVTTGVGIGAHPPSCSECGTAQPDRTRLTYTLDATSQAKVAAYRERRGWAA